MSAILQDFQPMLANVEKKRGVRIEHVCTGESTVEPLPYLVDAQRRSDQVGGRNTWVLVGSQSEEAFLISKLRSMFSTRAYEEGEVADTDDDEARWGVRGTEDIQHLAPDTDCIVVTTTEAALTRLMAAKGSAPKQFSNNMTFMLDMGWGNLRIGPAYAYNRLVRFVFDTKDNSDHFICTISSAKDGPFHDDWVVRRQDCRVIMQDEEIRSIQFSTEEKPRVVMDNMIDDLKLDKKGRAIVLMEYMDAKELETIGPTLGNLCHNLTAMDEAQEAQHMLSVSSMHVIVDSEDVTYLGSIPHATHVIIYPWRHGCVWDRETSQVVSRPGSLLRNKPELRYAMGWRGDGKPPNVHYLGTRENFDNLEEDSFNSMAYTSQFDNLLLSCLSVWPELPVSKLPLKVGRNPDLVEERLRRLMYKGLLVHDDEREPLPAPEGFLRSYGLIKMTPRGRLVSELVNPYITDMDSVSSACLVGQLFEKMRRSSPAVIDAVCSLVVVLAFVNGGTYIDAIIKPKANYKAYTDKTESLAIDHCHRGPLWLAVCVLHSVVVHRQPLGFWGPSFGANGGTMTICCCGMDKWGDMMWTVQNLLGRCDVEAKCGNKGHRLTSGDLLEVEDMLVTAFMDKLAFVFVPAGEGQFGYSMTTLTELDRPTDEQMRLIDLDKCWEEDKKAVGKATAGIYCIFTHYRMECVDGREIRRPYDLTYVSATAVRRALSRVDVPMIGGDLFSKIQSDYKLDP